MLKKLIPILFVFITITTTAILPLNKIKLPSGFHISVYAKNIAGARQMALGKNGVVFVGSRRSDKVVAIIPNKNLTQAKKVIVIARHLDMPNGVAFHDGDLYVAETSRIVRYKNIMQHLMRPPKPTIVTDTLPTNPHHGWRVIKFGSDGWLYVGIGAPCNVCIRKDPRFATIMRMHANGSDPQIFAKGVRNSVGFAWDPATKDLWFTDNGRDWLGDNLPPDELNVAPKQGMDFGFPYFYGNNVPDPKYGTLRSSTGMTPPALDLDPHVAALGMVFYTGKPFPKKYHNQIFIAEHGSWNRSRKIGYRIIWVRIKNNHALAKHIFASGWLQGQRSWGRPVDVLVMPDGALLVSDDFAGVIYRIGYQHKT